MNTSDVRVLQEFLISQNTASASVQLKGNGVSSYFGTLTKAALVEWQKANNITPSVGYFGPKTRTVIKLLNL